MRSSKQFVAVKALRDVFSEPIARRLFNQNAGPLAQFLERIKNRIFTQDAGNLPFELIFESGHALKWVFENCKEIHQGFFDSLQDPLKNIILSIDDKNRAKLTLLSLQYILFPAAPRTVA